MKVLLLSEPPAQQTKLLVRKDSLAVKQILQDTKVAKVFIDTEANQ